MLETIALKLLLKTAQQDTETSTVNLADEIGVSQQSVSRVLAELEHEQLIIKKPLSHGLNITLTAKGRLALSSLQERIAAALEQPTNNTLRGIVQSGLGEGKYYLSLDGYKRPLTKLLGGELYPGTLNVQVDETAKITFLANIPSIEIPKWNTKERTYGPVTYYPVRIVGYDCGLIMPMRTTHGPGKIELVATTNLRARFKLRDGDELIIERRTKGE